MILHPIVLLNPTYGNTEGGYCFALWSGNLANIKPIQLSGHLDCYNLRYYLLGKGGYLFGGVFFFCLSVCLWTTILKKL